MSVGVGGALRVGGLDAVVLARSARGDGRHQTVSARLAGRDVVIKIYGRKRGRLSTGVRSFGHRFLVGKTGLSARARRDTEARLLALWAGHGFAVPAVLALALPEPIAEPVLVLERVDGPLVDARLRDPAARELAPALAAFASAQSRRHALAESLREPGLVHAHPSFAHLIDRAGVFTYFDFEYAYTDARRIEALVDVEIAGFIGSLARAAGPRAPELLRGWLRGYTDRCRLERAAAGGAVGRFRGLAGLSEWAPFLRGQGPRRLRQSIVALRAELERSP
jgi:tRNA A-37 threonylcarbamoyl transferase component Bud32